MKKILMRPIAAILLLVSASACCLFFPGKWDDGEIDKKELSDDEDSERPLGIDDDD